MNSASLSFIFFRVFSVSSIPGMKVVVFALSSSYFSSILKTACFSLVYSFWFLPLFFIDTSTFLSMSKTLSFWENNERGKPCFVRWSMVSARAAL